MMKRFCDLCAGEIRGAYSLLVLGKEDVIQDADYLTDSPIYEICSSCRVSLTAWKQSRTDRPKQLKDNQ